MLAQGGRNLANSALLSCGYVVNGSRSPSANAGNTSFAHQSCAKPVRHAIAIWHFLVSSCSPGTTNNGNFVSNAMQNDFTSLGPSSIVPANCGSLTIFDTSKQERGCGSATHSAVTPLGEVKKLFGESMVSTKSSIETKNRKFEKKQKLTFLQLCGATKM